MATPNFGFDQPTVGGSTNIWGTILNTFSTAVDAILATRTLDYNFADYKLKRALMQDTGYVAQTVASVAGVLTIDLELGNLIVVSLTENITSIVMSNFTAAPNGGAFTISFTQDGTGGRTVAFPSSWRFALGTPTVTTTANRTDVFDGLTFNAGTSIGMSIRAQGWNLT